MNTYEVKDMTGHVHRFMANTFCKIGSWFYFEDENGRDVATFNNPIYIRKFDNFESEPE